MDGACGTYGRVKRCIQGFGRDRDNFEDPAVDGRPISKWVFNK